MAALLTGHGEHVRYTLLLVLVQDVCVLGALGAQVV